MAQQSVVARPQADGKGGFPGILARIRGLRLPAAVITIVAWLLYKLWRQSLRKGRMAPQPEYGWHPFGHLFQVLFRYADLPDFHLGCYNKLGKVFRVKVGPEIAPFRTILNTSDPANLTHILKTRFDNYVKGTEIHDTMLEIFGHGIFGVDGDSWYKQRKTAALIFTGENMRTEVVRVMLDNSKNLIKALRERSCNGTKPVDVQELFFSFTLDTFCEVGFGVQRNTLTSTAKPETKAFATAFDGLQQILPKRFFRQPLWRLQRIIAERLGMKGWPVGWICGDELQIAQWSACVHSTLDEIIVERQKYGALNLTPPGTPGSSKRPGSGNATPSSGRRRSNASSFDATKRIDLLELFMGVAPPMHAHELRDVIMSLLVGGRDTTAVTLAWAFYQIAKDSQVESRVREEARSLNYDDPEQFYSALKDLKYTDAVVRETIRLHSPVPLDAKVAIDDDVLPDGTFVGAGWDVTYSPYCMARDTDLWGPDAAVWKPQRWLEGDLAAREPSPFVMSSFQAGPRMCLGRDLAIVEAKAVIAILMHAGVAMQLDAQMGDKDPVYLMGVVLKMAPPGLLMNVKFDG